MLIEKFIGVEGTVHPINSNFNQGKVQESISDIGRKSSNVGNAVVSLSIPLFNQVFTNNGKQIINKDGSLCKFDLIPNNFLGGSGPILEDFLGSWMDVAVIMEDTGCAIVHKETGDKVPNVA